MTRPSAPAPIGPYSPFVVAGDLVFTAGQIALDPASGELIKGDVAAQTRQVFQNLRAVLLDAGTDLDQVVKATVFLRSMDDAPVMNAVFAEFLGHVRPARSTVAVAGLPKDALVEIEVIARRPHD